MWKGGDIKIERVIVRRSTHLVNLCSNGSKYLLAIIAKHSCALQALLNEYCRLRRATKF